MRCRVVKSAHLHQTYGVSQRRACRAVGADRGSVRYRSQRPDDSAIRARLRELAAIRRRFGYRRLLILLQRFRLSIGTVTGPRIGMQKDPFFRVVQVVHGGDPRATRRALTSGGVARAGRALWVVSHHVL